MNTNVSIEETGPARSFSFGEVCRSTGIYKPIPSSYEERIVRLCDGTMLYVQGGSPITKLTESKRSLIRFVKVPRE